MSDTHIGSTMTPVEILANKVSTIELTFNNDILKYTGVTQDYNIHDNTKLASAHALASGIDELQERIDGIDPDKAFLRDNTVITLPLISTNFSDTWEKLGNWFIMEGKAVYIGDNKDNYLKIPASVITSPGYYFLSIKFSRFDSGSIKIYNNNEVLISSTDRKVGVYSQELFVDEADTVAFSIKASNVLKDERIVIDSVGFYKVTARMKEYMNFILSSSGVELTEEKVREIATSTIGDSVETLDAKINTTAAKAQENLRIHESDKDNPHEVTPELIDAARKDHIHPKYESISVDINSLMDTLNLHISNVTDNPHHVTPEMIGAAIVNHTHTLASLNAASVDHNHDGVYTTATNARDISTEVLNEYKATLPAVDTNVYGYRPWIIDTSLPIEEPLNIVTAICHKDNITANSEFTFLGNKDIASTVKVINEFDIDSDNNVVVFNLNGETEVNKYNASDIAFVYNFKYPRTITGITLYKSSSPTVRGFVTGYQVFIDDNLIKTFDNDTWSTLDEYSVTTIPMTLDTEVTGNNIKIVVTKINTEQSNTTGDEVALLDNKVGVHFKIDIKDAAVSLATKVSFDYSVDAYIGNKALHHVTGPVISASDIGILSIAKSVPTYITMHVTKTDMGVTTAKLTSSIIPYTIQDSLDFGNTLPTSIANMSTEEYNSLVGDIFTTCALSGGGNNTFNTADILNTTSIFTCPENTVSTRVNYTFTKRSILPRLYGYRVYFDTDSLSKVATIKCTATTFNNEVEKVEMVDIVNNYQRYHDKASYYECLFPTPYINLKSLIVDITPESTTGVWSIKAVVPLVDEYSINRNTGIGSLNDIPICKLIPVTATTGSVYFTQSIEKSTFTQFKRG